MKNYNLSYKDKKYIKEDKISKQIENDKLHNKTVVSQILQYDPNSDIPNFTYEGMYKIGTISLLNRDKWVSISGDCYNKNQVKSLLKVMINNDNILTLTLHNKFEKKLAEDYLEMGGKIIVISTNTKLPTEKDQSISNLYLRILKTGTILYPFIKNKSTKCNYIKARSSTKQTLILESLMIRARLSKIIISMTPINKDFSSQDNFHLGFAKLLNKKTYKHIKVNGSIETPEHKSVNVGWEINYKPLEKYVYTNTF